MSENLGTARLDIYVNSDEFIAGVTRMRNAAAGLGTAAEEAMTKVDANTKRASLSLIRYTESLGKTAEQMRLLRAGGAGVPKEVIDAAAKKMTEFAQSTAKAAAELSKLESQTKFLGQLGNSTNSLGKTQADLAEIKAAELGVAEAAAPMIAQMREFAAATDHAALEAAKLDRQTKLLGQISTASTGLGKTQADLFEIKAAELGVADAAAPMIAQMRAFAAATDQATAEAAKLDRQTKLIGQISSANNALGKTRADLFEIQAAEEGVAAEAAPMIAQMRAFAAATDQAAIEATKLQNQTRFLTQLGARSNAIGKTAADLAELEAAALGVSKEAAPMVAKLREAERVVTSGGKAFNQYGLSTKQATAALRQVPAQITDIIVSLQGGQAPLTVLLQQGGQLKDVFGGVKPALAGLAQGLIALVNPYTIAAAAAAGLVAIEVSAENQTNALSQALILSGQSSVQSADGVRAIAEGLDKISGFTVGGSLTALEQIIATGRIAVDQQALVAEAAIKMQNEAGVAIKTTIGQYADIGRDPVNALYKLNEATGFATQALIEQIQTLSEHGQKQEAARVLTEAFAKSQIQRTGEIKESLGLVTGAWEDVKHGTGDALDAARNYFHDVDVGAASAYKKLKLLASGFSIGDFFSSQVSDAIGKAPLPITAYKPVATTKPGVSAAQQDALKEIAALRTSNLSREDRQKLEITHIKNLAKEAKLTDEQTAALVAQSQAQYKASLPKGPKPKSTAPLQRAGQNDDLQNIKDDLSEETQIIANNRRQTEAEYSAKLITAKDYYAKSRTYIEQDTKAQEAAIGKEIAVLRASNIGGVDRINNQKKLHTLEAQLGNVRAKSATDLLILTTQEKAYFEQREAAFKSYTEALHAEVEGIEAANLANVRRITLGQKEAQQLEALTAVRKKAADALKALNLQNDAGDFAKNPGEFERRRDAIETNMTAAVNAVKNGFDELDAVQANWQNGLHTGIVDFITENSNVAQQIHDITTGAFNTLADGLVNAATTGKLAWKDMLRSILVEIEKFLIKQAVISLLKLFGGSFASGNGGEADSLGFNAKGGVYGAQPFAKGGAFTNTVVASPTLFKFGAGGSFGVMGEAGPEAIMPLRRGPDGSLGVQSSSSGGVIVNISTVVNSDGSSSSSSNSNADNEKFVGKFSEKMAAIARQQIQVAMQPQGDLWAAGIRGN